MDACLIGSVHAAAKEREREINRKTRQAGRQANKQTGMQSGHAHASARLLRAPRTTDEDDDAADAPSLPQPPPEKDRLERSRTETLAAPSAADDDGNTLHCSASRSSGVDGRGRSRRRRAPSASDDDASCNSLTPPPPPPPPPPAAAAASRHCMTHHRQANDPRLSCFGVGSACVRG